MGLLGSHVSISMEPQLLLLPPVAGPEEQALMARFRPVRKSPGSVKADADLGLGFQESLPDMCHRPGQSECSPLPPSMVAGAPELYHLCHTRNCPLSAGLEQIEELALAVPGRAPQTECCKDDVADSGYALPGHDGTITMVLTYVCKHSSPGASWYS